VHGQAAGGRRGTQALREHGAARPFEPARGYRQHRRVPRVRRGRDDHGQYGRGRWGTLHLKVVPLAAESLGVRSMPTYVEAGDLGILIDPGATLAPARWGLPPAEAEWEALRRANDRISAYAARARLVFVSHYHDDHFRSDPVTYVGRTVLAKDPRRMVAGTQAPPGPPPGEGPAGPPPRAAAGRRGRRRPRPGRAGRPPPPPPRRRRAARGRPAPAGGR